MKRKARFRSCTSGKPKLVRRELRHAAVATAAAVAALAALALPGRADAAPPVLDRGDEGPQVRFYQDELQTWLAYARPGFGGLAEDGVYGPRTAAATRELEQAAGITVDGVAEPETWQALYRLLGNRAERILIPAQVVPEWPIPVPDWFWAWARWYLHRGEFRDEPFRGQASRPDAAPLPIPEWAWRRLNALNGRPLLARADHFLEDRVQAVFGPGLREAEVTVRPQARSAIEPGWVLLTATFETQAGGQGQVAAWLRLVRGRWAPWEMGRLGSRGLNLEPSHVPCDLKPAFAEPFCTS